MKKNLRILTLDACDKGTLRTMSKESLLSQLQRAKLTAEVDSPLWASYIYHQTYAELIGIAKLTMAKPYDLIVVGNNMGSGIRVVCQIPEELRRLVVVASNDGNVEKPDVYARLGVHRITKREHEIEAAMDLLTDTAS